MESVLNERTVQMLKCVQSGECGAVLMLGDRSLLLRVVAFLASTTLAGYVLYLYRAGNRIPSLPESLREGSPQVALEHFARFRDESVRKIFAKLDDARQSCLRIRSSLLSPSGGRNVSSSLSSSSESDASSSSVSNTEINVRTRNICGKHSRELS